MRRALPRNCEVIGKAASNETGSASFYIPVEQDRVAADRPNVGSMERSDGPIREVTVETLRFVKIDVEGHEAAVLAGAWQKLETRRPTVLLEILQPQTQAARSIFDRFLAMGYHCIQLQNRELRAISRLPDSSLYRIYIFWPSAA